MELPQGSLTLAALVVPLGGDELARVRLAREDAQVEGRRRGRGIGPPAVALEERAGDHRSHDEDGRGRH